MNLYFVSLNWNASRILLEPAAQATEEAAAKLNQFYTNPSVVNSMRRICTRALCPVLTEYERMLAVAV